MRRQPWLAAALSFVSPGTGQLYNGDVTGAAGFFTANALLLAAGMALIHGTQPQLSWLLAFFALVLVQIGFQATAALFAHRTAQRVEILAFGLFQRPWIYGVAVAAAVGLQVLATDVDRWKGCGDDAGCTGLGFVMGSASMEPFLAKGEHVLAEPGAFRGHVPVPGDVVVYRRPMDGVPTDFVHRVVAVAGDRVQMRDGRLYLNGVIVAREPAGTIELEVAGARVAFQRHIEMLPNGRRYTILERSDRDAFDNTAAIVVPPGHVYVLGDNRDLSIDSRARQIGPVPLSGVGARPRMVYWGPTWSRIGTMLAPSP
ncbi:MAG TPA: signal peptidase I [Azospirillaceae bacterium]|nr:signal peptidase I [Azospirillaceae bacterium]